MFKQHIFRTHQNHHMYELNFDINIYRFFFNFKDHISAKISKSIKGKQNKQIKDQTKIHKHHITIFDCISASHMT